MKGRGEKWAPPYLLIAQSSYKQGKQSQATPWSEAQYRTAVSHQIGLFFP
jgi:hypothetical protein